ncbi:SDR family NAD(P)-dependent oxidoreductase [Hephaestia sp. GCM10023244]|uniref:SDR family NAD(P)-dependent oxidoreductase n=1 Tax=unclassified Hephaestia TaxID=2631281 RepID=UPI00207768B2|nr:SDR family oxidoreductase [Hephaestia sp. MAHUQ-44]MCM8732458.1 SDR family oxidoreductase [Hephaestia sp. MAHUQ-44]
MNGTDLTGSLALVTGGTRGIGFASARALAVAGADIILVGRDARELDHAAAQVRETGRTVHVEAFDLAQSTEIAAWFEGLRTRVGTPDILVNSAGVNRRGKATDLTLEEWDNVMAVNVTAIWELSRHVAKALIDAGRPGRVINIASLMTAASRPGTSPYTASKGAVGQLTKALAIEWAPHGILVNAIAPGYIATDLNKALIADPAFDAWVKGRCPIGRWGEADDIAAPVAFLASKGASFITGQTIYVDGGWLATF